MKIVRTTASALKIRTLPRDDVGTETSARLVAGQTAESHGISHDGTWTYIVAPTGAGWASSGYLELAPVSIASPAWPKVPHGLAAIRETFGEAANAQCYAGRVTLPALLPLSYADQHVRTFACHVLVEAAMQSAFNEVHRRGLWHLIEDFGGCYNNRSARGLQKKSTHSWGIAFDINVHTNGLGRTPKLDGRIVAIIEDHGFRWGGRFSRPDGMHAQYATGY
jgi:hypothetical protein